MAAPASDVISWQEAMQQVGDDEEFLKELLADLRSELQTQLTTIQGIIQVRVVLLLEQRIIHLDDVELDGL